MKKNIQHIILIVILAVSSVNTGFAQERSNENVDFFVQNQNNRGHDVIIYPNPVTEFKFKIKSTDIITRVEVVNIIGQCMYYHDNNTLSHDDLFVQMDRCEKGMYLVKITFEDNKSIIKKLLVK